MEKMELSYTVGGNVTWYSHYGEWYEGFFKSKKNNHMTQQSHSWAYNLEKTIIPKDTCSSMFTAALFT